MSGNIDARFGLGFSIPLGTVLKTYLTGNPVTGDFDPTNNFDSLSQTVTGSYDPNDKRVVPEGAITNSFISSGKYLDYTIRFQNTGTDTAFTVKVRDTLSTRLDVGSFEILSTSHSYSVNLKGEGILEWKFDNILLPDSTTNESKSHGFVRYRIKPKTSLLVGEEIKNKAAIYFDYNLPVITNETVNIVTVVTSVNPGAVVIGSKVFPNPVQSALYIQVKGYFYYNVYDASGKRIFTSDKKNNEATFNASLLSKGLYFIEIWNSKGKAVHKILIN
jgi:uncharacterized repeat protein (TIGR01451 family)